jgi:hypothetical protein
MVWKMALIARQITAPRKKHPKTQMSAADTECNSIA